MGYKRWKLDKIDLLKYALLGVRNELGHNTGHPFADVQYLDELDKVEREIMRRLKIMEKRNAVDRSV